MKDTRNKHSKEISKWSIDDARELYGINRWGLKYFDINSDGFVTVSPLKDQGASINFSDVIREAAEQGLHFPMLIRLQDLLRQRVERINNAFLEAIKEFNETFQSDN